MSKPTGRNEHIAVNLELVYPEEEEGEEYSPEELRAKSRGWYGIDWNAQREEEQERRQERRLQPIEGSRTPIKIKTVLSPSPNKGKIRRKGRGNASPTMTFHTKAATDEIYSIFNQPLKKADSESGDSEESDFESDGEGDYTTTTQVETTTSLPQDEDGDDADSVHSNWSDFNLKNLPNQGDDENESDTFGDLGVNKATGKIHKLSIFSDEPEQPRPRKLQIPSPPKDFDPPTLPYHLAKDQGQSYLHSKLPFMTPIVERTEQLPGTAARNRAMQAKTPSRVKMPAIQDGEDDAENDDDTFMGGDPFRELSNGFRKSPPQLDLLSKKQPLAKRKEPVPQGPIIDDKVCNPLDEGMRALVFQKLQPPLKSYEGYYEYSSTNSGKAAEIKKYTRIMAKQNSGGVTGSIPEPPLIEFITGQGGSAYTIRRELGKGAFAPVYLVENHIVGDLEEEAEDGEISPTELEKLKAGRSRWEALKMEHPPNPWEFYMIYQAHQRLAGHRTADSIIKAHEMHLFKDEGFLLLSFRDQGTILDLINLSKSDSTSAMDELLAMFLTIELLRTTEALHANSLIHGDLKADNCLVRFDPVPDAEWSTRYHPSGAAGWSRKGISLIDFGRGIDMRLFQPNVQFIADWKTDNQDCAEMRELRPWTYQVDYHGLAAIVHSMLFGKYIETVAERTGLPRHYRIASPLKRYWEREIWSELFDVLLNPLQHVTAEEGGVLPINAALRRCRERMEAHLVAHCDKGVGLKSMVRKMEVAMGRRR